MGLEKTTKNQTAKSNCGSETGALVSRREQVGWPLQLPPAQPMGWVYLPLGPNYPPIGKEDLRRIQARLVGRLDLPFSISLATTKLAMRIPHSHHAARSSSTAGDQPVLLNITFTFCSQDRGFRPPECARLEPSSRQNGFCPRPPSQHAALSCATYQRGTRVSA